MVHDGEKNGILIVEDEEDIVYFLKKILTKKGYNIIGTAKDGTEAVEKYKKLNPELVTLDIMMHPTDGKVAARKILEFDPKANIVIVSVLDKNELSDMSKMGIQNFISKPIDIDRLTNVVDTAMRDMKNANN